MRLCRASGYVQHCSNWNIFFFPQNTLQFLSPGKRSGSYKGEQVELFPSRSTKPIFSLIVLNAGSRSCSEQDRCWVWFTLQPEPGQGIKRSRRSRRTRLRASTELPQVKIITQPPPSVLQTTCWCPSAGCCGWIHPPLSSLTCLLISEVDGTAHHPHATFQRPRGPRTLQPRGGTCHRSCTNRSPKCTSSFIWSVAEFILNFLCSHNIREAVFLTLFSEGSVSAWKSKWENLFWDIWNVWIASS